jgi:hypothetical protein
MSNNYNIQRLMTAANRRHVIRLKKVMEEELPTVPWKERPTTENEKLSAWKVLTVVFWATSTQGSLPVASTVLRLCDMLVAAPRTVQAWLKQAGNYPVEDWITEE